LFRPQVDHVDFGVAANYEQVAARGRHARNMHRITCFDGFHDFFRVAINQCNFTVVAQCYREQVTQVQIVHLLGWAIFRLHEHFPSILGFWRSEERRVGKERMTRGSKRDWSSVVCSSDLRQTCEKYAPHNLFRWFSRFLSCRHQSVQFYRRRAVLPRTSYPSSNRSFAWLGDLQASRALSKYPWFLACPTRVA